MGVIVPVVAFGVVLLVIVLGAGIRKYRSLKNTDEHAAGLDGECRISLPAQNIMADYIG